MKGIVKGINWLAAAVLVVAIGLAWLQPIRFFGNPDWASPLVQLALVLGLLVCLNAGRQLVRQLSAKQYHWLVLGAIGLVVVVQGWLVVNFVDVARADAFYVRQQALVLASGGHQWQHYFMIYPNNVNMTLLEAAVLKPLLHLTETPWFFMNGLRFLWADTALVSGLYLLKQWRYWQPGALGLVGLWLVSVPVAAYGLFAYTDVLVLPLMLDSLAILTLSQQVGGWRRGGLWLIDGLLVAAGVLLKTNLIVLWLALVMIGGIVWRQRRWSGRQLFGWLMSLAVTLLLMVAVMQQAQHQAGYQRQPNAALPATSWIAMSLNPKSDGQYRHDDFALVNQQPTAKAKQQQAQQMIQQRLQHMGATGTFVHLLKKLRVFWATGDFDSFKLTTQWIRAPRWYWNHQRQCQFWLVLMTQTIYLVMLVQAIVALLQRRDWPVTFLALTILGLTIFHVGFWEVEGRYALPLLPGLMLLSLMGGREIPDWQFSVSMRHRLRWLTATLAAVSLISLWQTSQSTRVNDVLRGSQGNGTYVVTMKQAIRPHQVLKSALQASGPSNTIQLQPDKSQQPVTITLAKGKRTIKRWTGTPNQLKNLVYPVTAAGQLQLTIKNQGKRAVRYGVVTANYSPLTGQVTAKSKQYLQYAVKQHYQQPATLTTGKACLVVIAIAWAATSWSIEYLSTNKQKFARE